MDILPREEEERSKEVKSVLLGLCLPLTNYLVSFSTPELPWDPLLGAHAPLSQDGSQSEGF